MDFAEFEKKIGVNFSDRALLKQAFTHRSYLNENRKTNLEHNERLEFLGDAVLELIVTAHLYEKYPTYNEGEMTSLRSALVNANTMAEVASKIKMNDFMKRSLARFSLTKDIKPQKNLLANSSFRFYQRSSKKVFGWMPRVVSKKNPKKLPALLLPMRA